MGNHSISFSENLISFFRRKVEDNLSQKIHINMSFFRNMIFKDDFFLKVRYYETLNVRPGLTRVIKQFLVFLYTGGILNMGQLLCLEIFRDTCVSWPPAPALVPGSRPNMYLPGPVPALSLYLPTSIPQFVFTGPG